MGGRVHPKYTPTTGLRLVSDEQMSIWDDHFPYTKMVRAKDSNKVGSGSHQPVVDSFFCNLAWNYPPQPVTVTTRIGVWNIFRIGKSQTKSSFVTDKIGGDRKLSLNLLRNNGSTWWRCLFLTPHIVMRPMAWCSEAKMEGVCLRNKTQWNLWRNSGCKEPKTAVLSKCSGFLGTILGTFILARDL